MPKERRSMGFPRPEGYMNSKVIYKGYCFLNNYRTIHVLEQSALVD
ncbi:hypothetical protein [Mucilaginibacter rubeus]|nr:hypothetical protein [Mucilaginibacter rubeus]